MAARRTKTAPAAPAAEPVNHKVDAAQAFLSAWLPNHGIAADAFTADDAAALVAAIDHGHKAAS